MISFQELCLMYCGEKDITNMDKEQLIYCIHIYEGLVGVDKSAQDKICELLESSMDNKAFYIGLKTEYDLLMEKYNSLYKKWEEFSKCLDMEPEKFISMLDDLEESIKNRSTEILQLREQLKTFELDAKRYKNDGIQDRVKLQEVLAQLESMTKMRDNWKADCEYSEECFQAERDRRWELEEEVKQLKKQLMELTKTDYACCVKNKEGLAEKKLSVFESPRLSIIYNGGDGYCNINLINGSKVKFIARVKECIDKDSLSILDMESTYVIWDTRTGDYLYRIGKDTYNVEKISHLKFETIDDANCWCLCKKCKKKKTKIYVTIGLHKVLVDTVDHEADYTHYRLYESSQNCCIRGLGRDFKNYSIDKETLKVRVIDQIKEKR